MRTLLLGTDFVYGADGVLRPIEINTNIQTSRNKLEQSIAEQSLTDVIMNRDNLISFITDRGFTEVTYIGKEPIMSDYISIICNSLNIGYEFIQTVGNSITVPYVEDTETKLIIRQSYDTTALVDDTYCRDKVEFLKLIQNEPYGSQFAYRDENGELISTIIDIVDNGTHPNFILKSRYPDYDREVYPKLYKVTNESELNVVLQNVTDTYFLMPYYFNETKLVNNKVTKIRSLNILYPPTLESFALGQYTDTTLRFLSDVTYDNTTFQLDNQFNRMYVTSDKGFNQPKLLDTDLVQLSDGTFKTALELQVGDELKTIIVPNADNVYYMTENVNYEINLETFLDGAVYTTNTVKQKYRIETNAIIATISFSDGTDWQDTSNSRYLVVNNGEVKFKAISQLVAGDEVILIDTTNMEFVKSITKQVSSVTIQASEFQGWIISVDKTHIFLTKTEQGIEDGLFNYATLEHNCYSPYTCPKIAPNCNDPWIPGPGTCTPSDKRIKRNIEYKHTLNNGLKLYTYEYDTTFVKEAKEKYKIDYSGVWEGVIAQDLLNTNFESALVKINGYYMVDYKKLKLKPIKL